MDWDWHILTGLLSLDRLGLLNALFADDLFLSLDELEGFPADLFAVFVVAFEVGADVGDDFGGFIFLDEADDGEDVEDFGDEVLEVEVFLLVHEGFNNLFDACFGHHVLLVNQTVEDLEQQLPAEQLRPQRGEFSEDQGLLVPEFDFRALAVFILLEFADHAPESDVDHVILRDAEDESECFEVEDDVEGPALVLEDLDALINELSHFEDGVFLVVH